MQEFLKALPPDQIAIITAVLIYVTKETWAFFSKAILKNHDKTELNTSAIKELILEIKHLEKRLNSFEEKLDKNEEVKHLVWKLEKDIGFAFEKIRDLRQ